MKYLKNLLKGLAIGIATLVPGVSGGTMSVVLCIYDDLIHSISSFFDDWKKHISLLSQIGIGGLAGIIIAVALILPGISVSFMLLTLGLYGVTLNAIN